MGFFDIFKFIDINEEMEKAKSTKNSVILDVRTVSEYNEGHIAESLNIPVEIIEETANQIKDKSTPLFVYCLSGARSAGAVRVLQKMGYENVSDMGGIMRWKGEVVR